jgi:signal transduction histidine kinase
MTSRPGAEQAPEAGASRGWPGVLARATARARAVAARATARARAVAASISASTRAGQAGRVAGSWPLRWIIGACVAIGIVLAVVAVVAGGTALADLAGARGRVVNQVDPAAFHASQLGTAFLNQETGVRGYALSGQRAFLAPYTEGLAEQQHEIAALHRLLGGMPAASADLALVVTRADAWRSSYAAPTIRQVSASGKPIAGATAGQGKADFDRLRRALAALQADLASERARATASLSHSAALLNGISIGIGVALLLAVTALALGLHRFVIRPLSRLAAETGQAADGDFEHPVTAAGPLEVRTVGADVDRMRERILAELSTVRTAHARLAARTEDLQRSNAELEQFAYVASHDLQEPLRKVASFCQLLQRRYAGQLDEKADEYIEHAVDGAKRMQALINDLLAFSRVGRIAQKSERVSCAVLLAQAWANLAPVARKSRATIEVGDLPVVLGEASLLTAVFQNLLSNSLKFGSDQPPRISVQARRDGTFWLFSFADNGIGIEAEYAERIFVIFQRLHDRATYPGTGIGLAMCRKIVEYHGGRIWLDTAATSGTRFCFTLPVLPEDTDPEDAKDKDTDD